MNSLVFPRLQIFSQRITNWPFIRRHSLNLPYSVLCHLTEVALPFAPWELLHYVELYLNKPYSFIAKAISVKSSRAVITADELSRVVANAAHLNITVS